MPSYLTMDARLACYLTDNLEVSLVGQNLLDSSQPEFHEATFLVLPSELQRGFYGMVSCEY